MGLAKALKDCREAQTIIGPAPSAFWDKFDRRFLGVLVGSAILASAAFAYIVMTFVH